MAEETKQQVNVLMDDDLAAKLDQLVEDDLSNRSVVIRKLIAREFARKQQLPLPAMEPVETA